MPGISPEGRFHPDTYAYSKGSADLAVLRRAYKAMERWDDAPLVEAAEAIYAAELPVSESLAARVARLREAAEGLARVRRDEREEWRAVSR